jgi:hypothetical protein
MTTQENQDLNNFNKAKEISLTIGVGQMRRATAEVENPFFGANLKGLGTVVLWESKDQNFTKAVTDGSIAMGSKTYNFRKVAEYTILVG